jgi:CheY-like chemotaxis protein
LVVDDVEASRKLLFQLLHPLGFEVRTASDGGEGLEVWEAWRPHLIFMDIGMPGTDGREVTKHIRAHIENERQTAPAQQCLPIIVALTASAFDEDRETILAEGCDDFVMKPFREAAIFEVLSRHLGIRFVYADETAIAALPEKEVSIETLKVQAQNLPAEWRIDIQQAALVGDVERLNTLVAQVRDQFPALARHLAQYVYNFEYNKIRQLIQPEKD